MKSKDFIEQEKIDKLTLKELHKLDRLNLNSFLKFGDINLLSLTIVQIQTYLSSSIINKKTKPYDKFDHFPIATSRYLNSNIKFYDEIKTKLFKSNYQKLRSIYNSFVPFANISTFNVYSDIYENLKNELNKNLVIRKKATFVPIYLNNLDEQIKILHEYLDDFAKKNKIKNNNYAENFIKYIKPYFSNETYKIDDSQYLFVGTNSILENRITSANYILNNRTVISFNHANYNTLIIDEPHQEYSEHVFCDYYVDYGLLKKSKKYLKSNFLSPKKIINLSNPKLITDLPKKKNISQNFLYVPDSFNGDKRHGPYREMDDKKYLKFQNKILLARNNILIKVHPKSNWNSKNSLKFFSKKMVNKKLSDVISEYPLFIIDRISQAFFEIAKGKSKILYFYIGRRKIRKEIIKEIKKRAYVVNIDPYNAKQSVLNYHIKKAINFKIKKSKIMNLACIAKKSGNKKFLKLLKF